MLMELTFSWMASPNSQDAVPSRAVEFKRLSEAFLQMHLITCSMVLMLLMMLGVILTTTIMVQVDKRSFRPCLVPNVGMIILKTQRAGCTKKRVRRRSRLQEMVIAMERCQEYSKEANIQL